MKLWCLVFLTVLVLGCGTAPPSTPPLPATPPPPEPERQVNAVVVAGQVFDPAGAPVPHAAVTVAAADADCAAPFSRIGAIADASGFYEVRLEAGVGPEQRGCAIVTAESGGATGRVQAPVSFTVAARPETVDVRLQRGEALTEREAEKLVEMFAQTLVYPSAGVDELARYVESSPADLHVSIAQYRQILGSVAGVRQIDAELQMPSHRRVRYELTGSTGRTAEIDVYQDRVTRLHGLLLDYGARSEHFMNRYVRAISSGDAVMLARLRSPDDIDFPVERAREIVLDYRKRYDTGTLRAHFVDADETRRTITWRIEGLSPSGDPVSEEITLITGDGLIGIR